MPVIVAMHIEHEPLETCIIIIMATELIQSLLVVVAAVESRVPSKIGTRRFHSIPVPNLHMHKRTRGSSLAWPASLVTKCTFVLLNNLCFEGIICVIIEG